MKMENSCRCRNKAQVLIDNQALNPNHLNFSPESKVKIKNVVRQKTRKLNHLMNTNIQMFFREQPFVDSPDYIQMLQKLIMNKEFIDIFNLN